VEPVTVREQADEGCISELQGTGELTRHFMARHDGGPISVSMPRPQCALGIPPMVALTRDPYGIPENARYLNATRAKLGHML
jgi:hypothetical protein